MKKNKPFILLECKASNVKINQNTIEQILRYNQELKSPTLLISNGLQHYCYTKDEQNKWQTLPNWVDLF